MGRMHTPGKGMSRRALPYKRSPPSWLKVSASEVNDTITKLARKGNTPSQIGVILRDSHGVAQVSSVTGSKVLRILKSHGLAPDLPEDLYFLIKKAVSVRKHLERNRRARPAPKGRDGAVVGAADRHVAARIEVRARHARFVLAERAEWRARQTCQMTDSRS